MTEEENLDNLAGWESVETPEEDNSRTDKSDPNEAKETRRKQQLEWSKKEAERVRKLAVDTAYNLASKDATSLLDLHSEDPKLANEVAQKFWFDDFYDAKSRIDQNVTKGSKATKSTTSDNMEKEFEKWYKVKKADEIHEMALWRADKLLGKIKDEDLREWAKVYFDKLSKWRKLSIDEAEEFAEMATLYVNRENLKSEKYSKWLADYASSGLTTSKKVKPDDLVQDYVVIDGRLQPLNPNNK